MKIKLSQTSENETKKSNRVDVDKVLPRVCFQFTSSLPPYWI